MYSQLYQPLYPLLSCRWFALALIFALEEFFQQKEVLHRCSPEKQNKKFSFDLPITSPCSWIIIPRSLKISLMSIISACKETSIAVIDITYSSISLHLDTNNAPSLPQVSIHDATLQDKKNQLDMFIWKAFLTLWDQVFSNQTNWRGLCEVHLPPHHKQDLSLLRACWHTYLY